MQDSYVARNTGLVTTTPAGNAESMAVHNLNAEYVRLTVTFDPSVTTTGNLQVLIPPYATFQEDFHGDVILSVTTEAVTLPIGSPTGTSVATLSTPPAVEHIVAIKFLEA